MLCTFVPFCAPFFMPDTPHDTPPPIQEARQWSDGRWTAQVIKNEDDDGWAVAMTLQGKDELDGLTRSFATMTQQIADARAAVEQSMGAVVAARAKLQTIRD